MNKATAAVFEGPKEIVIKEFPLPKIKEDEMLVQIDIAGIDGTEVHMYLGDQAEFNTLAPCIIGDELIGTVYEIGEKAAERRGLKVGDRVTVEAHWPCNDCHNCHEGLYYLCDEGTLNNALGWISCTTEPGLWGAYATHLFVPPQALVYKIPNDMPLDTAISCVSVLANGIRATDKNGIKIGTNVVVLGPGPQGLMTALACKESGASNVIMVGRERSKTRLEIATSMGADYVFTFEDELLEEKIKDICGGSMADVCIDTTGSVQAAIRSVNLIRPGGLVNHFGLIGSGVEVPLRLQDLLFEEKSILPSFSHPYTVQRAIDLGYSVWKQNKYPLDKLVTHRFGLYDTELALQTAGKLIPGENPIKTVVYPQINSMK